MTVLKGHSGLVKGVTWDPVGKYLASQSDDKTLRVWRTSDWQQETFVSEPFADCSGTTHVLRLSWSPDGHYVVSAHAMNNSGPVAKILERDGWKMKMDFVGHRKAVTCVVRIIICTCIFSCFWELSSAAVIMRPLSFHYGFLRRFHMLAIIIIWVWFYGSHICSEKFVSSHYSFLLFRNQI